MRSPRTMIVGTALAVLVAGSLASTPTGASAAPKKVTKVTTLSAALPFDETGQVEAALLTTLDNGLLLYGTCNNGGVFLELNLGQSSTEYLALGFSFDNGVPTSRSGPHNHIAALGDNAALALIAAPSDGGAPVGSFTRIDVEGALGTPCQFWGLIIPTE